MRTHIKETSKSTLFSLREGNSPVIGEFSAQRASNAERASIWWRHHETVLQHPTINQIAIFENRNVSITITNFEFNWMVLDYKGHIFMLIKDTNSAKLLIVICWNIMWIRAHFTNDFQPRYKYDWYKLCMWIDSSSWYQTWLEPVNSQIDLMPIFLAITRRCSAE